MTDKNFTLTQDRLRELLHYDPATGVFTWHESLKGSGRGKRRGMVAGAPRPDGYVQIMIDKRNYRAHRLAWLYVHGEFPNDKVDHKNNRRADNWIDNLRPASSLGNNRNKLISGVNKTGYKGVVSFGNFWRAQIKVEGKNKYLGLHLTREGAARAYDAAAIKYFCEFAKTNAQILAMAT